MRKIGLDEAQAGIKISREILITSDSLVAQMANAAMKLKDACSLEESYDQTRQHVKSRDITLPTKICLVKAMVFPVVTYGCESWT